MKLSAIIQLIRPHHYIKNLFIFLPLFFAQKITNTDLLLSAVVAFMAFSVTASGIYVLNDYLDIEEDRQHPKKKNRPLASGEISKPQAVVIIAILMVTGFSLMACLSFDAVAVQAAYVIMNIAYSYYLKHVAILDVTIISIGFVLRLFIGSVATTISLSMWIVTMTFLLALFLALAKRRDDVLIYINTGKKMRPVIDGYNLQFLDIAMGVMSSVVIVAYTIYTTSSEVVARINNEHLYLTALFVIVGILRYMQIAFVLQESGSPTQIILKDRFMQLTVVGWFITFGWMLY